MKKLTATEITNIADPRVRAAMMRETVTLIRTRPDLGFVLVSLVAAFIDGLAKGVPGNTRMAYLSYLTTNFPELCAAMGAEVFYGHIRGAAIHEFAPRPPFALGPDAELKGQYTETREYDGQQWTILNADRLVSDFMKHLDSLFPEK